MGALKLCVWNYKFININLNRIKTIQLIIVRYLLCQRTHILLKSVSTTITDDNFKG